MKNTIIAILLLVVIVVGYYAATTLRLPMEGLEGKTEKVIRADLTLPINATGEVRPALRVEVKSEASGEVTEIAKRAGDRVRAGDLLIRLQPDDEQRSVDRSTQDLQIAEARLNTAKINLQLARGSDLLNAKAQVDQLEPMVTLAKFRKEKLDRLPDDQIRAAHFQPIPDVSAAVEDAVRKAGRGATVCVLPNGPQTIPYCKV